MARQSFVIRDGQLVEKHLAAPHPLAGRRLGRAPYIRTDGMDPLVSMADGRTYDSRSAYYDSVRQAGCEIVGDDRGGYGPTPTYKPEGVGEALSRAFDEHTS